MHSIKFIEFMIAKVLDELSFHTVIRDSTAVRYEFRFVSFQYS